MFNSKNPEFSYEKLWVELKKKQNISDVGDIENINNEGSILFD